MTISQLVLDNNEEMRIIAFSELKCMSTDCFFFCQTNGSEYKSILLMIQQEKIQITFHKLEPLIIVIFFS